MLRRALIAGLTLATALCGVAMVASFDVLREEPLFPLAATLPGRTIKIWETTDGSSLYVQFLKGEMSCVLLRPVDPSILVPKSGFGVHGFARFRKFGLYSPSKAASQGYQKVARAWSISLWLLVIAFGTYPVTAFIRGPLRRSRRRKRGQCVNCGYDLRGSPDGRCPECGDERPPGEEID